jgi:hypothetical protein
MGRGEAICHDLNCERQRIGARMPARICTSTIPTDRHAPPSLGLEQSLAPALSPTVTRPWASCIAELRANEEIEHGKASTPFLKFGDRVRIEMFDEAGQTIFGAIDQRIIKG